MRQENAKFDPAEIIIACGACIARCKMQALVGKKVKQKTTHIM